VGRGPEDRRAPRRILDRRSGGWLLDLDVRFRRERRDVHRSKTWALGDIDGHRPRRAIRRRRRDPLVPWVDGDGRVPRRARDGHAVELDLQTGRDVLAIDPDLELREPLLEVRRAFVRDALAIRLRARLGDR